MSKMNGNQPITVAQWLAERGITRTWVFPESRVEVELRQFDLMDFVTTESIPKPLVNLVEGIIDSSNSPKGASVEIDDLKKLQQLIKLIAKKVIASPEVIDIQVPDNETAIPLNLLGMTDLLALFEEVSGNNAAKPFPEQS